jgi:hypothetical protein
MDFLKAISNKIKFFWHAIQWVPRIKKCGWDVKFWGPPRIYHPENLVIGKNSFIAIVRKR